MVASSRFPSRGARCRRSVAGRLQRVALERRSTTTSPSSAGLTDAFKYTNCMRANGIINYPDPSTNGRPQALNNIDVQSPAFLEAY
jgi:hypothetical protein